MNREEMLKRLHLSDHELKDLLEKFMAFRNSLNHDQRETLDRSLPRLKEALESFGPGATKEELEKHLCVEAGDVTICLFFLFCDIDKDRD